MSHQVTRRAEEPFRAGDPRFAASIDPLDQPVVYSSTSHHQQQRQFSTNNFNPDKFSDEFSGSAATKLQDQIDTWQGDKVDIDAMLAREMERTQVGDAKNEDAEGQGKHGHKKGSVTWAWEDFHSKF